MSIVSHMIIFLFSWFWSFFSSTCLQIAFVTSFLLFISEGSHPKNLAKSLVITLSFPKPVFAEVLVCLTRTGGLFCITCSKVSFIISVSSLICFASGDVGKLSVRDLTLICKLARFPKSFCSSVNFPVRFLVTLLVVFSPFVTMSFSPFSSLTFLILVFGTFFNFVSFRLKVFDSSTRSTSTKLPFTSSFLELLISVLISLLLLYGRCL
ncbi:305L [Invertebrate iridescent virus Kaz2018]|uniref:305L n=1 Tax=Invertebrate iridescent virus 6 TaxID=176652 RepID=Q91FL9_IIV6|nr:305L [Invertebrate iridescent virus 6]AAK82166.1 305L [Invertebrate iridescent virus 6]QMS79604.1 hypothetical protein IIV6-T1_299 [Invertebrate iridescent virus 6]QNH08715.1 305L [Invertebrate iridescent virus Kaz2018]